MKRKIQILSGPSLVIGVIVLSLGLLVIAQSLPSFLKFEAEAGTPGGQAEAATDDLASGGSYLSFTTTPPQTGVLWSEDFATLSDMDNLIGQGSDAIGVNNNPESSSNGHDSISFHADHDLDCGPPTSTRVITANNAWPNHNYWCPNAGGHFMTAFNGSSYVAFGFAPRGENNKAKVFSSAANKICFDVNITGMGNRRWWDLLVLSEATYNRNSFPTNVSGLSGGAVTSQPSLVYFDPDHAMDGLTVGLDAEFHFVEHEGSRHVSSGGRWVYNNHSVINREITDKASRFKTCFKDNDNNTVTMTQDRPGGSIETTVMTNSSFPSGNRIFIIMDKTYNADKAENPSAVTNGYTWHWDNIVISSE